MKQIGVIFGKSKLHWNPEWDECVRRILHPQDINEALEAVRFEEAAIKFITEHQQRIESEIIKAIQTL